MRPDPAFACSRSAAHIALFSILLEQATFQVFLTLFYRHKRIVLESFFLKRDFEKNFLEIVD